MRLEDITITAALLGIPIAIVIMSRGKHAKSLNQKAIKYKKEIGVIESKKNKEDVRKKEAQSAKFNKDREEFSHQNTPSFKYSEQELKFRKDVDLIQEIKPLTWPGCFVPEGLDIDSYNEIYQGSGSIGDRNFINVIIDYYPWVKIYEAFFKNKNFDYEDIQVVSKGSRASILLNNNEIATRDILADYDGLLEVVTLSDAGHRNPETIGYLNRIIAAYGHNIIVNDAVINPRYGRIGIEKEIHFSKENIPWRIKNDFKNNSNIEMIDWTGSAKIEVRMLNKHNDPRGYSLETTLYMGNSNSPVGAMWSYDPYSIEDFDYYYKQ